MTPDLDLDLCDRVVRDEICILHPEEVYLWQERVGFGLSSGPVFGFRNASHAPFTNAARANDGVFVGGLAAVAIEVRAFLTYERLRVGLIGEFGGALPVGAEPFDLESFEVGSTLGDGLHIGLWATGAYLPQLSELVQLWLGGRVGLLYASLPVYSGPRRYTTVEHLVPSIGPEVGLRLSEGELGATLYVFADLFQLGHVQTTLAFTMELPKPIGQVL